MNPAAQLWKERLSAHMRTVSRYTVYAGQSGFFLFLLAVFIGSSYMYGKLLARLPDTFPHMLVITCWLLPFLAISPIRTLLREADLVFLLPMEAKMGTYFRRAVAYSFATQAFVTVFAVSSSMPIYRHGFPDDAEPYFSVLLLALALKFANLLGAWTEGTFVRAGHRALFRFTRWVANAAIVYVLYRFGGLPASLLLLAAFAALSVWARMSRRVPVNWPYLRSKESSHNTTMLLFFNWFVDVPELPNRVKPRKALSLLANLVQFRKENAFRFLYALTLLRSELFGIVLRLTLVALAILLVVRSPLLFAVVYALFQMITNVQLSALGRFHRHSVWPALYPIPASLRQVSAARIAFIAQLVQIVLLALPMFRPAVFSPWLLALPPLGLALAYAFRSRVKAV
ncbi:ABC transporter permease [Paenibacillus hemerocallicola]|uniref:ABC transporter permease n=1 Tax=Paenibacillus hemerocallicola TaxID=1172614 RepID=A0A5C4T2R2_9BACL|nr:ABC transporter permease [Paenibacillus hemerocallicola]TNJ62567.1 ABC transporter permease [Paenibacillus hemerocallicola]